MKNKNITNMEHLAKSVGLYNPKTNSIINITKSPSSIKKSQYDSIKNIQKDLNILYLNLSKDLIKYEFKDPLYKFLRSVYLEKQKLKDNLEIQAFFIRSDYLLDNDQYKQVEINTISQCFVIFGPSLNKLHSFFYPKTAISYTDKKFVNFLVKLKKTYDLKNKIEESVIAMVDICITHDTANYMEKVQLIYALLVQGIILKFVTISDLSVDNDRLVFCKDKRVSIIYYRWFYNFDQYDNTSLEIRRKLELSNVINLPSVEFQMINSKLFQVILADKSKLSLYTKNADNIINFFGEFIATKKEFDERSKNKDFDENMWLSKSVTEGGNSINKFDIDSIYMKKYNSPTVNNSFVIDNIERKIINEVSIFGSLISLNQEIIHNSEDGYIVRSKDENKIEGGICSGNGALDSLLFD